MQSNSDCIDDKKDENEHWRWDGQTTRSTDVLIPSAPIANNKQISFLQAARLPRQVNTINSCSNILKKSSEKHEEVVKQSLPQQTSITIVPTAVDSRNKIEEESQTAGSPRTEVIENLTIENENLSSVKINLEEQLVTYKEQCEKLISLLGPHEHNLWEAEQQITALQQGMQALIIEKSVFQEQCQQLSESLVSATHKQDGFMDYELEMSPLKAELSQVRVRVNQQQQQLDSEREHIMTLTHQLQSYDELKIEHKALNKQLTDQNNTITSLKTEQTYSYCKGIVKDILYSSMEFTSHVKSRSLSVANVLLQKELQAGVRESELLKSEVIKVDRQLQDLETEKKIVIKKKDDFIKQLQDLVRSGKSESTSTDSSPVTDDILNHENHLLSERVTAAEELNSALQKMLCQQESLISSITNDNDTKTSIIEEFSLSDISTFRNAISLPQTSPTITSSGGLFRNKKTNDKRTLNKALEETLSANCRLRENVKHLDEEIIRLRSKLS